jgi:gliding motility-associated-like protein
VQYSGLESFYCTILNRWGNVIYEYSDPAGGWNGKTKNGDLVSEGTYFYRIDAKFEGSEPVVKHGFIEVKY